ncbi:hypothetical protein L4C39_19175 [Vibrio clamense]|uniref:hypothetical protein n=1 Tax=Vibrio clamense TaxID=2910254 RepID=UPI003D22DCF6
MFEILLGGIVTVVLGVCVNLITPYCQRIIGIKPPTLPHVPESEVPALPESGDVNLEEWRANNRRNLAKLTNTIFFYGVSYASMYMAFSIPLYLHGTVDLASSKLGVSYVVNYDNRSTICAFLAVIAFIPFWFLSKLVANLVASLVIKFTFVNDVKYYAFTVLAMFFWSFFIAGNVSWIINFDAGWVDSMTFPLFIWIAFMLFSAMRVR